MYMYVENEAVDRVMKKFSSISSVIVKFPVNEQAESDHTAGTSGISRKSLDKENEIRKSAKHFCSPFSAPKTIKLKRQHRRNRFHLYETDPRFASKRERKDRNGKAKGTRKRRECSRFATISRSIDRIISR